MPIPTRFREICDLLVTGTENGSLKWSSFISSSYATAPWFATKLDGNIIKISAEGAGLGPLGEIAKEIGHKDSIISSVELRILDAKGDELDSLRVHKEPGMLREERSDFERLLSLWHAAKSQEESSQTAKLRAVTESLRARVMAGTRST